MKFLKRLIKCLFGIHTYQPGYEVRIRQKRGRGTVCHYRYTCVCCGSRTDWLSKAQKIAFDAKHEPSWGS